MRVTNTGSYRNFTNSINDVHSNLNKSMNKISSGKAYESAADNPLAYYEGKKIDNLYQDTLSKMSLITDVKNRVYQQELGARSIQESLATAKTKLQYIRNDSNNGDMKNVETIKAALLQEQQSMVNDLNSQYQNSYIFGGNDTGTPPFALSSDGKELTYTHTFPGETTPTVIKMTLQKQTDGSYAYNIPEADLQKLEKAMSEQGRVDVGYGSISDKNTLLDTFTGGLNLLTGLTSDAVKAGAGTAEISKGMENSPIALIGKAVMALDEYIAGGNKEDFSSTVGNIIDSMTSAEHSVSSVYSDLGNKYELLESTNDKLSSIKLALTEQYKDKLGADPYESIMEMYSYQNSYSASLQLGSNIMKSSLFDFMR